MIKLARMYLKPFVVSLLLAVVLLYTQSRLDLSLPNYMSDIVNVGIQQAGVSNAAPEAVSEQGYTFIRFFMDEQDRALLDAHYRAVGAEEENAKGKAYAKTYPDAERLYIIEENLPKEQMEQLDAAFGTATWTMIHTLRAVAEMNPGGQLPEGQMPTGQLAGGTELLSGQLPEGAEALAGANAQQAADAASASQSEEDSASADQSEENSEPGEQNLMDMAEQDIREIYAMVGMLQQQMPPQVLAATVQTAREQALEMDDFILKQSGPMLVRMFYRELGVDMNAYQSRYILNVGLVMLAVALASGLVTVMVSLISARVAASAARTLRSDIFAHVNRFSNNEFDKFSTASLITRSTLDVTQLQLLLTMGLRIIVYAPLIAVGGVLMALNKSISMGWIIAAAVITLSGIIVVAYSVVVPRFKRMQTLLDRLSLVAREALNGLMVIRAFGRGNFEKARFETANRDLAQNNLFVHRAMTFIMPIMMFMINGVPLLIIWVGSHQVAESSMQVGDMMAFMQYAMQIIMSFLMIAMMFIFIPRASVSARRILEVLQTKPGIDDPAQVSAKQTAKGTVAFKNVCFRYQGAEEDALSDITFQARPGQVTAFIGATGSGKSTIANLIARFYDVTAGQVLVNGADVREITQHELRRHIGYVPQKSVLLSGTIGSNIAYGNPDAAQEDITQAAAVAQATGFIAEKEEGFDAEITQGGSNVSGGQRQRLAIARALAIKPDIYIFDDSFSALDFKTDAALRRALHEQTGDAAVIIIAQRVSTIMNADAIHVLEDGKIIGHGTHRELLQSCPTYLEIAASQLSEKELKG